jgi:hypothetical protein
MKDEDPSIATKQRIDGFAQALGQFLKGLLGSSNDTMSAGLPTPVTPASAQPEKGAESDKSS